MDRWLGLHRRTMTFWEQMSKPDPAISDFIKVPHDDDGGGSCDAYRMPCTLMDAICRDSRGDGTEMINWKPLHDRLRIRPVAHACSTSISNHRSCQEDNQKDAEESKDEAPTAGSMSLMALLERTEGQWDDDGDDEEDSGASTSNCGAVVGDEQDDSEGMVRACCVCMVQHKGAAFIPCGHTFCRLCSRGSGTLAPAARSATPSSTTSSTYSEFDLHRFLGYMPAVSPSVPHQSMGFLGASKLITMHKVLN